MNEARYTRSGGTTERTVRMRSATCSGDSIMVMRTSITPIVTSVSAGSELQRVEVDHVTVGEVGYELVDG